MRKFLALLVVALAAPAAAQDGCPNAETATCLKSRSVLLESGKNLEEAIGDGDLSGGGGDPFGPQVVEVCASGCDATVICDATCGTRESGCVAGSGVELARAAAPTSTNPVVIDVLPGLYDECVAISDLTDFTFHLRPGAKIRPSVAAFDTVNGGALRVGNAGPDYGVDRAAILIGGAVHNDAFNGPEAALQIGEEFCAGSAPTWRHVRVVIDGVVQGFHDGVQWCGEGREGPNTTELPRLDVSGNGVVVAGRDAVAKKGNSIDTWQGVRVRAITNYAEDADETLFGVQTGTVQAGSGTSLGGMTSLVLEGADAYAADGGYGARMVAFSDNGGGCGAANACDATKAVIRAYDAGTNTAQFDSPECAITTGCDYSIAAVSAEHAGDRDVDWSEIAATAPDGGGDWKVTGVHFGIDGPTVASSLDSFTMRDAAVEVVVTESAMSSAACTSQSHIAGILAYTDRGYGRASFENVDVSVDVLADQGETACAESIAGISLSADSELDVDFRGGSIRVRNEAEPELNTRILDASTSSAERLRVADTFVALSNPVGYAGTSTHLHAANAATIEVAGQIEAAFGELLTVSGVGNVEGWTPICQTYPNASGDGAWDALDGTGSQAIVGDQQWFRFVGDGQGWNLYGLACASRGAGTDGAIYSAVQDIGGGTIVSSVACDIDQGPLTWRSIPAAQVDFAANEQLRWFLGTESNGSADDMLFCIRATTNRWAH